MIADGWRDDQLTGASNHRTHFAGKLGKIKKNGEDFSITGGRHNSENPYNRLDEYRENFLSSYPLRSTHG